MSQSTTPSRFKVNAKTNESPAQKARAKSVTADDAKKDPKSKVRRSLKEDVRVVGRPANPPLVEQFARPRRERHVDSSVRRNEEESKKELQETLIKDLQSEILSLKAELDKAHSLNKELESQNKKLEQALAAAEAKVAALNTARDQVREDMLICYF